MTKLYQTLVASALTAIFWQGIHAGKVGDTRNQHPYVSHYVSAKSGKIVGFEKNLKL